MLKFNENDTLRKLCLELMGADTEKEVIELLKSAGYWENQKFWRYYGDRPSNFNTIGNQQSRPDAALVEKLVNSVDARLINESLVRKIDPEGTEAPKSIREAVARFFDSDTKSANAGLIREWPAVRRTDVAKGITLAATGFMPKKGNPCFTISDRGEGQTPSLLPHTILSLDRDNKVKIPFVQGKFNMGGTGVLEFCGKRNLQLVLSKRNPFLLDGKKGDNDDHWGFTVVRREDPVGGRKTSVYTYLAPVDAIKKPNKGGVLSFRSKTMPIFPDGQNPYFRESEWGTLIKLFEYSTAGFSSTNILLRDGLMRQLDLLLTDLALPIRIYECRDYLGHSGSFETNLTGIGVRLDEDKRENLEDDPFSVSMNVLSEKLRAKIYVFKKGKESTYRSNEGIIFSVNGQTHGYLSKNFFRRKKVGMSYLADSLLVIVDCSHISPRSREVLFMPSRDRIRDSELKISIEKELEDIISNNQRLKDLNQRRRKEEVQAMLNDEKPLGEILQDLIKDSPTLSHLFLKGMKLSNPFDTTTSGEDEKDKFEGKRFPTYFKFKDVEYGKQFKKNCHINRRSRINFETDAENMYFSRDTHRGDFSIFLVDNGKCIEAEHTVNLWNGIATLNLTLPDNCNDGDELLYRILVTDDTRTEPFINELLLNILPAEGTPKNSSRTRRKPPSDTPGDKRETPSGLKLPNIIKVAKNPEEDQKSWSDMSPTPFDEYSALRVKLGDLAEELSSDGKPKEEYDFFINVDNIYLKTEQKNSKENADLLKAKFIYGHVLLGLAILNHELQFNEYENDENENGISLLDRIEFFSKAISSVIIPIINELGELDLDKVNG